ncbi:H-2 class I histocompatibility antigen, Q10 alpha chain isoform X2 [Anolis carolinensis]|uniref:H-2 class I histocompatibility antigen, Q10 alpha chain isoform X2 n=1 Tax=Anolis carolinensis TaxID=28377 RepID=UPI002F2B57D7
MPLSRGAPAVLPFLLAFLVGRGAGSSSHSLCYFVTSVSKPGQPVPQFFLVGYVDDQQFMYYDTKTKRCLPAVPWIREVVKDHPQYWEQNSRYAWNAEQVFRVSLANVASYYNQSRGANTWQWMYGCELRRDGSKVGYYQCAFNGRHYISLDKETLTWIAADVPAQNTKRKWEAEPGIALIRKVYLEEECIEWLQRYLEYGKEILLRTEAPELKVTRKEDYDGMETLICHVRGFYPKEIDITWTKDGEVWMQDVFHGLVSPNSDGTYYTWWSIRVDPKEREHYKCHVEHDGLLNPVDVVWEEPASNLWLIIVCVVGVALLVSGMAGFAVYFKKPPQGYKGPSEIKQGSNSSGTEVMFRSPWYTNELRTMKQA